MSVTLPLTAADGFVFPAYVVRPGARPRGAVADLRATLEYAAEAGKVGMVGYCWGGLLTWRSAGLLNGFGAAFPYYGGGMTVGLEASRNPACPVLCHFGARDHAIALDTVEVFKAAQPAVEVQIHDAQPGFNCDHRGAFDAAAAALAREQTLGFFARHLA